MMVAELGVYTKLAGATSLTVKVYVAVVEPPVLVAVTVTEYVPTGTPEVEEMTPVEGLMVTLTLLGDTAKE